MSKKLKRPIAFIATLAMILSMLLYLPSGVMTDIGFGLAVSAEDVTGTTSGEGNTPADTGTTGGTGETPDNTDNGEDSTDEPAAVESESVMLLAEGAADFTPSQPSGDGSSTNPYQISNAAELYWFAGLVNGTLDGVTQKTAAHAKLTANITVNEGVLKSDGTVNSGSFTNWTPIGNYDNQYTGTFDGQNNTISGLYFDNGNTNNVGLFGYVGSGGNVSNVGIVNSYFNGKYRVGGVCGNNDGGTIQNCYNTGAVSGSKYVGGVCGQNLKSQYNLKSTIEDCYNTGAVSGSSYVGGVCGYNYNGTITNCYFDSDNYGGDAVGSTDGGPITDVEGKTTKVFESGEVCYLLQLGQENDSESGKAPMVWGQTIGTDKAPVLTSDSKKTVYLIGGTYSNTNSEISDYEAPELNGNVYEITNASQLYWFAEYVNKGNTSAEAILKENIDVNANVLDEAGNLVSDTNNFVSWTPIGNSLKQYTGTFNGNGKTISGLYFDDSGTDYVGLFGNVGSSGNVSNVGVVASYFKGKNNVGGVCGYNYGPIKNCYNTGAVNGSENVGGVCGNNNGKIQNCYSTGVVSGSKYVGGVCGNNNGGTITNCYFDSNNYGGGAVGSTDGGTITDVEGKKTNAFEKGEVCYLLQSGQEKDSGSEDAPMVWGQTIDGQTIDIDKAPVLTSDSAKTVYPKTTGCVASYSNTNSEITEKEHSNLGADFRCTDCGNYVAPELNKDVYEITNASQLYWFAKYVNKGNTSAKAILKENIVVNENVLGADGKLVSDTSKFVSWTPIGSESKQYTGTFDGNGKTISGLYFDNNGTDYVGLFGYVGSDGNVSNVGVVASYFKGKNNVGGVCGYNDGTIQNCYNTGAVSGSEYVGGVCGYYDGGTITNCYNTGAVSGSMYVGGVCGYNGWGTITNCYNTGAVSGSEDVGGVCGCNYGTIENCYYLDTTASDSVATSKTAAQFASGEVTYLLNGSTSAGTLAWGQTLTGENKQAYPVLGGAKVYPCTKGCTAKYANTQNAIGEHTATYSNDGFGTCTACNNEAYQPATLINGIYEISNAGQLYWFAEQVNGGNTGINAILTKDIIVNTDVLKSDGTIADDISGFRSWTPIGNHSNKYTGTFDGNGKTVSGLYFNESNTNYVGLFGYSSGTIRNVGVVDSYIRGGSDSGGVCGESSGTIQNCYNTGTVRGNVEVGGVCGSNWFGTIANCYNTGTVSGNTEVSGVRGNDFGTTTNCYYLADTADENGGKTEAQFGSGEVAYLLSLGCTINETHYSGEVWGQDLSAENSYPVLGGDKVYQTTPCPSYSNTATKEHTDENGDETCDVCKAKTVYIVSLTSQPDGVNTSVANLDGGGKIKAGESTTVVAPAVPGYTFNGWYEDDTKLSADLSFVYTPTADITLTAKYTANRTMSVTITSESANFNIAVNGGTSENFTTQQINNYAVGTVLTLTANGDDFDYWANDIGSVVSRSATFDYTVVGNVSLTAVFNKKAENKATVTFVTAYDQIIGRKQMTAADTIDVPVTPVRYGYDFAGWSVNGSAAVAADKVVAEIQKAVAEVLKTEGTADDIVMVRPVYAPKVIDITVTVYNGNAETGTELSYKVNDIVTVTAEPVSGMKFAYWTDGAGKILSYNETYKFYATISTTVKASYATEETVIEAKGTTEIVDIIPDAANGRIAFVSLSTVPEGCTIKVAGLIATTNESVANGTFDDTTAEYVRGKSWSGTSYRYTWNKSATADQTWYVKAYLVYVDNNGNTQTVYGNTVRSAALQ